MFLLACTPPPPPPAQTVLVAPPDPQWQLRGRAQTGELALPALPEAAPLLADHCRPLAEAFGIPPSPQGCLIEKWELDGPNPDPHYLLRIGDQARWSSDLHGHQAQIARSQWPGIDALLSRCLGDPLALPPGHDPNATRRLEKESWILEFSGQNPCRLQGELRLGQRNGRVYAEKLIALEKPWQAGGREAVRNLLHAALWNEAQTPQSPLSPDERAAILKMGPPTIQQ